MAAQHNTRAPVQQSAKPGLAQSSDHRRQSLNKFNKCWPPSAPSGLW